jgi:hypothetical protein
MPSDVPPPTIQDHNAIPGTVDFLSNYLLELIVMKCPEKYIKAYIFFIIQWIEFKFENVKYISIYSTNIKN